MTDAVLELPAATFDLPLALSGGTHTTLRDHA
ncbi:peroxiredoxin, partial [Xanthomonas perforans]|nr:peroxiredoxin [Xanthomonas perforans]